MSVSEKDISTCEIELSAWVFDYDQTEKEPTVTVYDGERELIQDTDFSVSYEDNINAGTATVTVTGIGKYKGTADRYFTINQISIDGIEIKGLKNKVYTGKAITQDFRVFRPRYYVGYPGITSDELYEDLDYSVNYENNVYPGTATVIITGMGNYYGTFYANFEITSEKRQISDCKVVLSEKNYYFSCMPIEPTVTLTDGYQELEEYLDYEVSYKNNINAGIGTVIITGLDTYEGTITEEFTIQRTNIKNVEVDGIRTLYYNGEALTQPLSDLYIGLDGVELSSDDYTIKYSNNVKPGTATMTITGKRNLTGSLKKTYKIQLTPTTYTNVSAKKGILYIISKKVSRISGYELQYSTNKKFKSGIKKIRGINNKKSLKISSLKRRTTYYFRIRTYKTISGKTYYSAWSKTGKINIK